ncbi:MAG: hypothetical protein JXQ87_16740 [Bacteroidia bacterium]
MNQRKLAILFISVLAFSACQNSKSKEQHIEQAPASENKVNHLFERSNKIFLIDLEPLFVGQDSTELSNHSMYQHASIIKNNGVDTNRFKFKNELTDTFQIKRIQKLLKDTSTSLTATECYEPRHAIAWYNADHELEAFLELCFECSNYKTAGNITISGQKSGAWFKQLSLLFEKE